MAEINRMNSAVSIAETDYLSSAMERALERERITGRTRRITVAARKYMAFGIALVVVVGILMQSITIYAMQRNLATINNQIFELHRTNETLKVTVLKARNLDSTKQEALAEEYVTRAGVAGLNVDLDYNNFTGDETIMTMTDETLLGKVFALFK